MTNDDRDIDSALREAVAGEVGRERFDLWFGDSVQLRLTDGSLLVSAADQFTIDRLRSQFRTELLAACRSVVDGPGARVSSRWTDSLCVPESCAGDCTRSCVGQPGLSRSCPQPQHPRRFARLDDYVVGSCNRVAYTAAQMIAERPGPVSPLFLFGPPGCGKTHLLEGIWSAVRSNSQSRSVLYLTAEQFTSMFLDALRGSGLPSFRHKYRHVDLLLIDDVQFFLGKRATLVELQNTVDALLREASPAGVGRRSSAGGTGEVRSRAHHAFLGRTGVWDRTGRPRDATGHPGTSVPVAWRSPCPTTCGR